MNDRTQAPPSTSRGTEGRPQRLRLARTGGAGPTEGPSRQAACWLASEATGARGAGLRRTGLLAGRVWPPPPSQRQPCVSAHTCVHDAATHPGPPRPFSPKGTSAPWERRPGAGEAGARRPRGGGRGGQASWKPDGDRHRPSAVRLGILRVGHAAPRARKALRELALGVQEHRVPAPRGTHHVLRPGTNGGQAGG